MTDESDISAIERDLGVAPSRGSSTKGRQLVRRDVVTTAQELQQHAIALVDHTSVPETVVGRLVDSIFPDPIRRERRRGDQQLAKTEIDSRVRIHAVVRGAQVQQAESWAEAFATACQLEAEEEIGRRAMEAATTIDNEIAQSGAEFDRRVEAEVHDGAANLKTEVAKRALADRLHRRIRLRGEIEEAILHSVRDVIVSPGRKS